MVKIAVAGGSGQIAREVIDVLLATKKHEILILSRKDPAATESIPGVTWVATDYGDKAQLTRSLSGVHTVLSFVVDHGDPGSTVQKALIDAAVAAGVKRFAPSEWATSNFEQMPWCAGKAIVRAYLEEINKEKKVLEYSLFQPGALTDSLAPPHAATKYIQSVEGPIDFLHRRAIVLDGHDSVVTLTTIHDLAHVVALAIEYEGEWPAIGGIKGTTLPTSKVLEIGAKVRGAKFDITALKEADLRAGTIISPWIPSLEIPNVPPEQAEYFSKMVLIGFLLSGIHSAWAVSDEWNRLLPDYKFEGAEEFLEKHWKGKE